MSVKRISLPVLFLCALMLTGALSGPPEYSFPLREPEILLAGTFGELRPNHFHSGIDIKTGGVSGKSVYAVSDGYVYRVKVSPYGYGKAIFLRHADGNFSVYAHLDKFNPEITSFVFQKQFASKQYEQDLYLTGNRIRVKRGDLLAWSGNTGRSHAPHLHFEIRDENDRIVNPVLYFPSLIQDHIPPVLQNVALQPIGKDSRVNGMLTKLEVTPTGGNGEYAVPETVELTGEAGLEYLGYDLLDGAPNHCGINHARLYLDNELIFEFDLGQFTFDDKKYINVHTDYAYMLRTGRLYERAWLAPGNAFQAYPSMRNGGRITLPDYETHTLRLELSDSYRNTTRLTVRVKKKAVSEPLPAVITPSPEPSKLEYEVRGNHVVIRLKNPVQASLAGLNLLFADGSTQILQPVVYKNNTLWYTLALWELNYPVQAMDLASGVRTEFFFRKTLLPKKSNLVSFEEMQAYFPQGVLFDTVALEIRRRPGDKAFYSDIYEIGEKGVPMLESFLLQIRPRPGGNPQHLIIAGRKSDGSWAFTGKQPDEDGNLIAPAGDFGAYAILADSMPPDIRPENFEPGGAVSRGYLPVLLRVSDNFSGIDSERILISWDGSWAIAEYDDKSNLIRVEVTPALTPGTHVLEALVYDGAGNLSRRNWVVRI